MKLLDLEPFIRRRRVLDAQISANEARLAQLRQERNETLVRQMRDAGATYQQIADVLEVSRQRAWQRRPEKV